MEFDPDLVRDFEHRGWQRAAALYRGTFAHASAPFIEMLLDAAGVAAGMDMLDLACGPGIVTEAASRRGAAAIGADFSPAMLELARAANPTLHFDEADAETLPYADAAFDAVVSNFGVHHFPRPPRAIEEMIRVLRPGGRLAFTAWAVPAENIAWRLLFDAIRAYGDIDAAKAPPSGGNLGTEDAASRLLVDAGFISVEAAREAREWPVASAAALVESLRQGTVRTAALIDAQPKTAMPAILKSIEAAATPYRRGDGLAVPIVAILARGTKPGR